MPPKGGPHGLNDGFVVLTLCLNRFAYVVRTELLFVRVTYQEPPQRIAVPKGGV